MRFLLYKEDMKCFDATLYEAFHKISLVKWAEGSLVFECHNQPQLTDVSKLTIFQLALRIRQFSLGGTVGRLLK